MLINLEARVDNGSDPGAVREKVAGSLEQKVVRGRAGRDAKVTGMTERVQESRTRLREMARLFHPPGFVIRPPEASRGWPSGSWEGPADTSSVSTGSEETKGPHASALSSQPLLS